MVALPPDFLFELGGIKELHAVPGRRDRSREHGRCHVQEIRVASSFSSKV